MEAVFYSLAFAGSQVAPVQLARSLQSLRAMDRDTPVFVFLFGEPPAGFVEVLQRLDAKVRNLGEHREYIARTEPDRAELFALNPTIHRWLIQQEPELKACSRLLYIDSDTFFFAPATRLFGRYRDADLYAREEPLCRRSAHGYNRAYLDEEAIADLAAREGLRFIPPFNTGVCLFTRRMADSISTILPSYFDYLFRFLSWFELNAAPGAAAESTCVREIHARLLKPAAEQALPYPSQNRWIADQVALWLALGQLENVQLGDFAPADVWQGGEFQQMSVSTALPMLCHYYGGNMQRFFDRLRQLSLASGKS